MKNTVITINHEYGSGGREIAELLAKRLNIPCYNSGIIDEMVANKSGLPIETISQWEERRTPSLLYNLYADTMSEPVSDKIFLIKSEIIRNLADLESCIFIGNCADYILRSHDNCINIFITAPFDKRVERVSNIYKETQDNARVYLKRKDKRRTDYYNYFSSEKWGDKKNYQIILDSSLGYDNLVNGLYELLCTYFNKD